MIDEKIIKAYALKNAVEHKGKALVSSVINSLFIIGLKKDEVKEIVPLVNSIVSEINSIDFQKQLEEYEKIKHLISHRKEREGLQELENVENGVIMRFAPSPSGPMHIGHAITGLLSSLYVKKYGGKFYFRIEDTNPDNIYPPAYKMLKEDAEWIFDNVSDYIIQSDRMEYYYKYSEKLIEKNAAYVCICDNEKFKKLIRKSKECNCRSLSQKENMNRWKKMLAKNGYKEGEAVLRFKSNLKDPNPAMRDFPLARINLTKHPRCGKKYRVWPLMNLAVSVDDIEYSITHSIRAKDHRDNSERQRMIYKALGLEKKFPKVYFSGRYNFKDMELSTTKIRMDIEKGKYSGWDDIRLPFLISLKKRGYQPAAFEKLVIQRGLSEVDKLISKKDFFEVLNNFNRKILKENLNIKSFEFKKANEKDSNVKILIENGKFLYGKSNAKAKNGEIVHFKGLGYAKLNLEKNKKIFWFCHE